MDHADHVGLLRGGITAGGGTWADVGAGSGAFTLALADLLGPGSAIVAVDRDGGALRQNARSVEARFPGVDLTMLVGDLTGPLALPTLDGIVAANSLHFVPRDAQPDVVRALAGHLRPGGTFIVVEYDADAGNPWVPHPFSAARWPTLATAAGLEAPRHARPGPEPVPRIDLLGDRSPALSVGDRLAQGGLQPLDVRGLDIGRRRHADQDGLRRPVGIGPGSANGPADDRDLDAGGLEACLQARLPRPGR